MMQERMKIGRWWLWPMLSAIALPGGCNHEEGGGLGAEIRVTWDTTRPHRPMSASCKLVGGRVDLAGYGFKARSAEIEGRSYIGVEVQNGADVVTVLASEDEDMPGRVHVLIESPYPAKVTVAYPAEEGIQADFVVRSAPPGHHKLQIDRPQ